MRDRFPDRPGRHLHYFIDEIFLPNAELLAALEARDIRFGVQTRIDLWKPDMLDAARESRLRLDRGWRRKPEPEGRDTLAKRCGCRRTS